MQNMSNKMSINMFNMSNNMSSMQFRANTLLDVTNMQNMKKKKCTICTICNHDCNMSNMHSPLCLSIIALPLHHDVALHVALCLQRPSLSLHIAGPSQCPWVDKPHPASVSGTLPAVAGRSRKVSAQAVGNGSCVADWNYRQFSQDNFNWNDVENWCLVV